VAVTTTIPVNDSVVPACRRPRALSPPPTLAHDDERGDEAEDEQEGASGQSDADDEDDDDLVGRAPRCSRVPQKDPGRPVG
jgi:hypothetical protein